MKAKNKIKMFAIIALVALVAVGSTLAYLSSVTDTKENKFTSSKDITGKIEETKWDQLHKNDTWENYTPGEATLKDPVIKIDGASGDDAYVAMKVTCIGSDNATKMDLAKFTEKYATVYYDANYAEEEGHTPDYKEGVNTDKWELDTDNKDTTCSFYFYDSIVKKGESTVPIFDQVKVNLGIKTVYDTKSEATKENIKVYNVDADGNKVGEAIEDVTYVGDFVEVDTSQKVFVVDADGEHEVSADEVGLPSFKIDVQGYAVQATGTDAAGENNYKELLRGLAGL